MTDNAHAAASRLHTPLPPSTSRQAGFKTAPSWPHTHTRALPVAIVKYHLSFSQRPSIAVYHPTPVASPGPPAVLPSSSNCFTGSSSVIFLYLVACPPPVAFPAGRRKAKAALGAEKRMENQFLTSGCYFSCQRFKAVAGAIKAEQRKGEPGRGRKSRREGRTENRAW